MQPYDVHPASSTVRSPQRRTSWANISSHGCWACRFLYSCWSIFSFT